MIAAYRSNLTNIPTCSYTGFINVLKSMALNCNFHGGIEFAEVLTSNNPKKINFALLLKW